jgi:hypothetical protein
VSLGFTDWTRAAGQLPVEYGNTVVAQLPYRNVTIWGGGREYITTYVFPRRIPFNPARAYSPSACRPRSAAAACTYSRWARVPIRPSESRDRSL